MYEIKIIDSRYKAPLEDEINKLGRQGWELFTFDVKETPQGLVFIASMKRKLKNERSKTS